MRSAEKVVHLVRRDLLGMKRLTELFVSNGMTVISFRTSVASCNREVAAIMCLSPSDLIARLPWRRPCPTDTRPTGLGSLVGARRYGT